MEKYVEAAAFTPRHVDTPHTSIPTSGESTPTQQSYPPRRQGSFAIYPAGYSSSFRCQPKRSRTNPAGNISLNTNLKPVWSVFTSPGSFEQLYHERAYLGASLKSQGQRSIELMRRLAFLHQKIDSGLMPSDERRRSRKKTALLKKKITEASSQEKVIMVRLMEISQELQIRERWMQIQQEIHDGRYSWLNMDSPGACYIMSPLDLSSVMSTPFDAASPMVSPMGCYPVYSPLDTMPFCQGPEPCNQPEGGPVLPEWQTNQEGCERDPDTLGNHGLRFDYDARRPAGCNAQREESDALGKGDQQLRLGRRMSLPSLRCLWPGL